MVCERVLSDATMNKYDEDYDAGDGDGCIIVILLVIIVFIVVDIFWNLA